MKIDGNKIYQSMPTCIEVFAGKFGTSIRSSKNILKGAVIDPCVEFAFIDNADADYELYLNSSAEFVRLHSFTNTLYYTEVERVCNGYIGYLNHSCQHSNVHFKSSNQFGFAVIASRDIEAHEELMSNYLLFDYSCDGHSFECTCGGTECYGNINGFKQLNRTTQLSLVDEITENVLHQYCTDCYSADIRVKDYVKGGFDDSFSHFAGPRVVVVSAPLGEELTAVAAAAATDQGSNSEFWFFLAFMILCDKVRGRRGLYNYSPEGGVSCPSLHCNPASSGEEEVSPPAVSVGVCVEHLRAMLALPLLPVRVAKHALGVGAAEATHSFRFRRDSPVNDPTAVDTRAMPEVELDIASDGTLRWVVSAARGEEEAAALDGAYRVVLTHLLRECLGVTDCRMSVTAVPLVDEAKQREITVSRNDTMRPLPQRFVFESLEANAALNPDKVALESHRDQMTYRAMVGVVGTLASVLQGLGALPEHIVGVMMPRDCTMVAALFGVLKSGAAYTALLCDFPEARLRYVLEQDCKAKLVVTVSSLASKFEWFPGRLVFMDRLDDYAQPQWEQRLRFDNLAYITYTSGSTGSPKGIQVEHQHLVAYTLQEIYHLDTDRYLHSTSITFDIVALEIYVPLVLNKLVFIVDSLLDPNIPRVGFIQGPSSLLEATPYTPPGDLSTFVSQVGEKLTIRALKRFGRIFNGYGTAETVNISVCRAVSANDDIRVVGKPQTFTWIYLLGSDLTVLPDNITGEIYIGGPCVSRGYLNLPELTASKFIANPFGAGRMYKTGDMGKWTPQGELMLVGRVDNQIKRNGVRIELGEIEVVAARCVGVDRAVATFSLNRLSLFWTGGCDPSVLQVHLGVALPPAMIPNNMIPLAEMPLGSNGKVDKMALPQPSKVVAGGADEAKNNLPAMLPSSEAEQRMHDLWRKLLRVGGFDLGDTFFQVGGDSMRLVQLLYAVKSEFGVALRASDIYAHDTVPALVRFIETQRSAERSVNSKVSSEAEDQRSVVSYYQMHHILWFDIHMSVRITFPGGTKGVDMGTLCHLLARKFPILRARLLRPPVPLCEHDRSTRSLRGMRLFEMTTNDSICVEVLPTGDQGRESRSVDAYTEFSRCCVSDSGGNGGGDSGGDGACMVFHLSHLAFDGFSIENMFRFIDGILAGDTLVEVEDFVAVQRALNTRIISTYDRDMAHWERVFRARGVHGQRSQKRMEPLFDKELLAGLGPFEMIHLVSSKLPFQALFHIETAPLRTDSLNLFQNGCFLVVDRDASVADIERQFRENVQFSSVPIFVLINAFSLCNMVYLNHALMRYDGYRYISVELLGMEEGEEHCSGHYPVSIVYNGPDAISMGINSTTYYCDPPLM